MARDDVTIDFKGLEEVEDILAKKFGEDLSRKRMRPVIYSGAKKVQETLKSDMKVFEDTGATIKENVVTKARISRDGTLQSEIKWDVKGKQQRFRLVHLNEWGYERNGKMIKPRGFGVIEKSVRSSSGTYQRHIRKGVEQWLK